MKFPNINEQDCPVDDPNSAPSSTGGLEEGSCPDPRCSDPAFAAANPLLCGSTPSLVLKPASAIECANSGTLQFTTFLRASAGETQVTVGVYYSSSDSSIVSVDPLTGAATILSAGLVTITSTWQGMAAFAHVTVLGGNCCDDVCVQTVIVQDNSKSMGQTFGSPGPATKGEAAHALAKAYADGLQEGKDYDAVISFNQSAALNQELVSVIATVNDALNSFPWSTASKTNIKEGLDLALETLDEAAACGVALRQQVILLISDGANQPPLSDPDMAELLQDTDAFKNAGGIIIGVGIRAWGDGFTLLQRLASGGFFLNVVPDNYYSSIDLLKTLLCYFCGGGSDIPSYSGYGGYCVGGAIPAQEPDPNRQLDNESGTAAIYSSTKTACVTCSSGLSGPPQGLIPAMTSNNAPSGVASASSESTPNYAAWKAFSGTPGLGWIPNGVPSWLRYSFPAAVTVTSYEINTAWNSGILAWTFQGSNDGTTWTTLDTHTPPIPNLTEQGPFTIASPGSYLHYRLNVSDSIGGAVQIYELKMFGGTEVSTQTCRTASATSDVSQADADSKALAAAQALAEEASGCVENTSGFRIKFNNAHNPERATPYPSIKTVSGLVGAIAKVTVTLKNFKKQSVTPAALLLVSPDGVKVLFLWMQESNTRPLQGVNLVIDDAAATPIPSTGIGAIPDGTYQPTVISPGNTQSIQDFPAPAPAQPYNTTLAAFIGGTKNGAWKLYAIHINYYTLWIPPNEISDGWDLTIT